MSVSSTKGRSARNDPESNSFNVIGTDISAVNPDLFVEKLEQRLATRDSESPGAFVAFRDVHGVVRARTLPALADAHRASLMNVPDGMPLVWLARLAGQKHVQRVCGPDMILKVCKKGIAKGWRHVLLGGTPETLEALEKNLAAAVPGVNIVAAYSPPFRSELEADTDEIVEQIEKDHPDFIWVGLGSPKQEIWMARNAGKFPGAICMGVGAAFDIHAGRIKRAPKWMHPLGVEWLYRIVQDPGRLIKRYAVIVPKFACLLTMQLFQQGFRLHDYEQRPFGGGSRRL